MRTDAGKSSLPLSLRVNFLWTLSANTIQTISQFLLLVAVARLGDTVMVGNYVYALALSAPVTMFFNMHLRFFQATDARSDYPFRLYLAHRLVTALLAISVIGLLGLTIGRDQFQVILIIGVFKCAESIGDICYGCFQKRHRMDRTGISTSVSSIAGLMVFSVTLYLTRDLVHACMAQAVARWLVLALHDLPYALALSHATSGEQRRPDPSRLRRLVWTTLPLGLLGLLSSFSTNTPRYAIEMMLGSSALGVFAAMSYLVVAGRAAANSLAHPAMARLAECYAERRLASFVRILLLSVTFAAALGAAGVGISLVAGRPLLALLFGPEYAAQVATFKMVMLAGAFAYVLVVLKHAVSSLRIFNHQLALLAIEVTSLVALCLVLVPRLGIFGAALAWCIALAAQVVLMGGLTFIRLRCAAREPRDAEDADPDASELELRHGLARLFSPAELDNVQAKLLSKRPGVMTQ